MAHRTMRLVAIGVLVSGCALAVGGSRAGAGPLTTRVAQTGPYGVNFTIHTHQDLNYCLEAPPETTTKEAIISQCATRDDQHWTFADAANGSIVLIDGAGQCVDLTGAVGSSISVVPCTFGGSERFHYTATGEIKGSSGHCLEAAQVAQDASVSFVVCSSTDPLQIFQLGH